MMPSRPAVGVHGSVLARASRRPRCHRVGAKTCCCQPDPGSDVAVPLRAGRRRRAQVRRVDDRGADPADQRLDRHAAAGCVGSTGITPPAVSWTSPGVAPASIAAPSTSRRVSSTSSTGAGELGAERPEVTRQAGVLHDVPRPLGMRGRRALAVVGLGGELRDQTHGQEITPGLQCRTRRSAIDGQPVAPDGCGCLAAGQHVELGAVQAGVAR